MLVSPFIESIQYLHMAALYPVARPAMQGGAPRAKLVHHSVNYEWSVPGTTLFNYNYRLP
jgi:hypothetical protein